MSKLHAFSGNVKAVMRDMADSDFKSAGYTIYLAVCAARSGVAILPNKSGEGEGMKGMTTFMKSAEIPTVRKGNLSKATWVVWTLIPHVVTASDDQVRDIVEALVGDRSLDDLVRESNEVRGVEKVKAEDSFDKALANFVTRCEALGLRVETDRADNGAVVTALFPNG